MQRRKSTPKKRAWEPAVYSDGESDREESYSDMDDLDRDLEKSSTSNSDDFSRRHQGPSPDLVDDRLVIDLKREPVVKASKDMVTKDAVAKEPYDVLSLSSRMKPESGSLVEQWMMQNQQHQYLYQSSPGLLNFHHDVKNVDQSPTPKDYRNDVMNTDQKEGEDKDVFSILFQ